MKTIISYGLLFMISGTLMAQDLSGTQLLDKAIAYHDPDEKWASFSGDLYVNMETPDKATRYSKITIDLPGEYFHVTAKRDTLKTSYTLKEGKCFIALNDQTKLTDEQLKAYNLSCDRAYLYRDYYTYLYGLPMKLKDPGTLIDPKVVETTFKGKTYLRLKATYDQAVGSDVWYFYFDPTTYAMEVYQFFKGDPEGAGKATGEYILLTGETNIEGIKMPKTRAWYYNKGDKYLGTDTLKN